MWHPPIDRSDLSIPLKMFYQLYRNSTELIVLMFKGKLSIEGRPTLRRSRGLCKYNSLIIIFNKLLSKSFIQYVLKITDCRMKICNAAFETYSLTQKYRNIFIGHGYYISWHEVFLIDPCWLFAMLQYVFFFSVLMLCLTICCKFAKYF